MWVVAEVIDENGKCSVLVPHSWLTDDQSRCVWPPGRNWESLAKNNVSPASNWTTSYPAKILRVYDNYLKARVGWKKSEDQSELSSSETDGESRISKRKGRRQSVYVDGGDCSSEEETTIVDKTKITARKGVSLPSPPSISIDNEVSGVITVESSEIAELADSVTNLENTLVGTPKLVLATAGSSNSRVAAGSSVILQESPSTFITPNRIRITSPKGSTERSLEAELLIKIAADVAHIKQSLHNLESRMSSLEDEVRGLQTGGVGVPEKPKVLVAPFKTDGEFEIFDAGLVGDREKALISEMAGCGGNSTSDFTCRILRRLLSDEVAKGYSLLGRKGNKNFSATKTWELIKAAILSSKTVKATELEIETATRDWLRHAGDRIKNRKSKPAQLSG